MKFKDRTDAGMQLVQLLEKFANRPDTVVLGIPRGGVPVASHIAHVLHLPLDIFLARKLGVPGHEEYAFGAVSVGEGCHFDHSVMRSAGITSEKVEEITRAARTALDERAKLYRHARPAFPLQGKTVILVDDGIATGSSILAAVRSLRSMNIAHLIVAVPVAPQSTRAWLSREVDELFVVSEPTDFYAVGQFYEDFGQTTDQEVVTLLDQNPMRMAS
ncbi:phosphoribosyltransferase [Terriglobus albidus]|uniref:Phosphoribosyltransferase n=1 Tax=Terriglobus albidus TaxID=1592106 RepID=A0A5B9E913_9BACT|nr:phosphoribosyltransferase [Terriglobus albidus]QEE28598.1 phosphoribosyltransferase [Terriglobus albidus]